MKYRSFKNESVAILFLRTRKKFIYIYLIGLKYRIKLWISKLWKNNYFSVTGFAYDKEQHKLWETFVNRITPIQQIVSEKDKKRQLVFKWNKN